MLTDPYALARKRNSLLTLLVVLCWSALLAWGAHEYVAQTFGMLTDTLQGIVDQALCP